MNAIVQTPSCWRKIADFPGYEVSSLGEVRSNKRGKWRILRPSLTTRYAIVTLYRDNVGHYRRISRIVCAAFHGPSPIGAKNALHDDGDCTNNAAQNLYWGSQKDNMADRTRHGRTLNGEKHHGAKLTGSTVQEIRRIYKQWKKQSRYGSGPTLIARKFGLSVSHINGIVSRKVWREI